MFDIFNSTICGRVAVDPEDRYTKDGKPMTTFSLAVNHGENKASFISVTTFGRLAKYVLEQVKKGSRITVIGNCELQLAENGKTYLKCLASNVFPGVITAASNIQAEANNEEEDYV